MSTPRVTLEQWRALQAVIDCGGYAQAAEYLHRSQSSVSYTVAKLQRQLGMQLLHVDGRKARLSEAGKVLLRHSRQLLAAAAELEALATTLEQGWEPEIRLVVDAAFPTEALMEALKRFAPLSRGTRVQLKEVVLSGAEEALQAGEADLVIGHQPPQGFLGEILTEIEFVAVAHPDHALHRLGRPLTTGDLGRELQVVIRDSGLHHSKDAGWLGAEHRWTVTSMETALSAIGNGLGFGWLPRHRIRDRVGEGTLKPLPLHEGRIYRTHLYLTFARPENPGPAAHQLAEILLDNATRPTDTP